MVTRDVVSPYDTVPLLHLDGGSKPGRVDRNHGEGDLAGYHPIDGCTPPAAAYLLVGVERGEEFCNVRPEDATRTIRERGRTPLTIDEGIALVTQVPPVLEKNKCFMLAGSRRHGTVGSRHSGSASGRPSSVGAGTAIRTPGWAPPPPARVSGDFSHISPGLTMTVLLSQ